MASVFVDIQQFYNKIWHKDVNFIIWSIMFLQVAILKHYHNIVQIGVFPVFLVAVTASNLKQAKAR